MRNAIKACIKKTFICAIYFDYLVKRLTAENIEEGETMEKQFIKDILTMNPVAKKEAMVIGDKYRFTVLTDCLIRMEYQTDGLFVDEPTQSVICRDFPVREYRVIDKEESLEIVKYPA